MNQINKKQRSFNKKLIAKHQKIVYLKSSLSLLLFLYWIRIENSFLFWS